MENQLNAQIKGILPGSSRDEVFRKIHAFRSHGTHADEWLRLFKWVLLPASIVFTVSFGLSYFYHLFLPYLGQTGAGVAAGLCTVFIEATKIKALKWFFRDIWFGLFRQNISSFLMVVMGGLIGFGGFWWSYYNSTQGVAYVSGYIGEYKVERQIVQAPTAEVDANLQATKAAQEKAWSTQWKGTTTWAATQAAKRALEVQALQEKQKLLLLEQAAKDQQRADARRDLFIGKIGSLLAFLGGKMEWFQLAILLGMTFCEKVLWDKKMQEAGHQPTAMNRATSTGFRSYPNGAGSPSPIQNEAPPVEYLNRHRGTGNVQPQPYPKAVNGLPKTPPTVAQEWPGVSQCDTEQAPRTQPGTTVGADTLLRFTMNKLQGEIANLQNKNGLPVSVVKRMQERVGEVIRAIDTGDFRPSEKEAARFLAFNDRQLAEYAEEIKAHGGLPEWRRVIEHLENFVTEKTV